MLHGGRPGRTEHIGNLVFLSHKSDQRLMKIRGLGVPKSIPTARMSFGRKDIFFITG